MFYSFWKKKGLCFQALRAVMFLVCLYSSRDIIYFSSLLAYFSSFMIATLGLVEEFMTFVNSLFKPGSI